jgi:hypothetical protein
MEMNRLSEGGAVALKCKTIPSGSDQSDSNTGVTDMPRILVDTNILIDVANNDAIAKVRLTVKRSGAILD